MVVDRYCYRLTRIKSRRNAVKIGIRTCGNRASRAANEIRSRSGSIPGSFLCFAKSGRKLPHRTVVGTCRTLERSEGSDSNILNFHLLSASGFKPDYFLIPHAGSTISGYTPGANSRGVRISTTLRLVPRQPMAAARRSRSSTLTTIQILPLIWPPLIPSLESPAPPSFKIVNQNGGTSLPGTDPNQGWEGETALDVEWAHAIAPGANILLVEANSASDSNLFAAVNYARQQPGVSAISMSWGSDDNASNATNDKNLSNTYLVTPSGHQGITFVASSGDDGHPSFPAESPNVLAVGGTDLYLTSSGAITNETAWTPTTSGGQTWSGGGGVSREFSGRKRARRRL